MRSDLPIIGLMGPTASGKTGLAIALARALDGVIINADAMQIYSDLAVITTRPTDAEMAQAPHRLFGVLDHQTPSNAAGWRGLAMAEIEAAWSAGRQPILVGGTGLHFKVLQEGIAPTPAIPEDIRARVRDLGIDELRVITGTDTLDRQRLAREAEVQLATGESLVAWQARQPKPEPLPFIQLALMPDRDWLYERINRRTVQLLEDPAAAEEVTAFLAKQPAADHPLRRAIGVPELAAVHAGEVSPEDALNAVQQATRRYAKRQYTWIRNSMPEATRLDLPQTPEALLNEALSAVSDAKLAIR